MSETDGERKPLRSTIEADDVQSKHGAAFLPEHCPTQPLGYAGHYLFVLDSVGQLHKLSTDRLGRGSLLNVCKPQWLYDHYPRLKKVKNRDGEDEWITTGWRTDDFQAALENSCKKAGKFNDSETVRGRGAYAGENGDLIIHYGDGLTIGATKRKPGWIGDYVYPAGDPLPRPVNFAVDTIPGIRLRDSIARSWNFGRPIDPTLLLGMLGVIVLGGALPVRPGAILTGEKGAGKTELMTLMRNVLGGWINYTTDTTEAGLRQRLGRDSLGMLLDEQESQGDNTAFRRIQLYWRSAYGGGSAWRGGASHSGVEFQARSTLVVSAINVPAMDPQDRSRAVSLDVLPFAKRMPRIAHDALWPEEGRKLIRRLTDEYRRIVTDLIPTWRGLLMDDGWEARHADTYGVILACSWAMLSDEPISLAEYDRWHGDLASIREAHMADELPTYRQALAILLGRRSDQYRRGEQRALGEYVMQAAGYGLGDGDDPTLPGAEDIIDPNRRSEYAARQAAKSLDARKASQFIHRYGLHIFQAPDDRRDGAWRNGERLLGVATNCPMLAEVFFNTPWGATGAGHGGWANALLRAPTAIRWPHPKRFPYGTSRIVAMRLDVALAGMVGPDGAESAESWQATVAADD